MQGLREKQKTMRRKKVIETAMAMFTKYGYGAVKLEEIALQAELSAGTVYSYFKTKNDLLLAVIVEDFETSFAAAETVINGKITSANAAVNQLTLCYFDEVDGGVTREMWRIAVAAFMRNIESPFAQKYDAWLVKMRGQYLRLVNRLRQASLLPSTLSRSSLADLLFNNSNMTFLEFIRDDHADFDQFINRLNASNAEILIWASSARDR